MLIKERILYENAIPLRGGIAFLRKVWYYSRGRCRIVTLRTGEIFYGGRKVRTHPPAAAGARMVAGNARPGKPEGCEQRRHAPRGARHRGHKLCALVSPAGNDGGETAKFLPTCKAVPSCAKHKEIPKYKTHITNKLQNPNDQNTKPRVSVIVVLNLEVV